MPKSIILIYYVNSPRHKTRTSFGSTSNAIEVTIRDLFFGKIFKNFVLKYKNRDRMESASVVEIAYLTMDNVWNF